MSHFGIQLYTFKSFLFLRMTEIITIISNWAGAHLNGRALPNV
jgi:hypothetical protein